MTIGFSIKSQMTKIMLATALTVNAASNFAHAQDTSNSDAVKIEQIKLAETAIQGGIAKAASAEDVVIPLAAFIFVLALVLGSRYLKERTQKQRLDLLRTMVDKGQTVPEGVIKELLSNDRSVNKLPDATKQLRNGYSFTVVGVGLLTYGLLMGHHSTSLIIGIVLLGLGVGYLAANHSQSTKQP